jgi:hypothetical protein
MHPITAHIHKNRYTHSPALAASRWGTGSHPACIQAPLPPHTEDADPTRRSPVGLTPAQCYTCSQALAAAPWGIGSHPACIHTPIPPHTEDTDPTRRSPIVRSPITGVHATYMYNLMQHEAIRPSINPAIHPSIPARGVPPSQLTWYPSSARLVPIGPAPHGFHLTRSNHVIYYRT